MLPGAEMTFGAAHILEQGLRTENVCSTDCIPYTPLFRDMLGSGRENITLLVMLVISHVMGLWFGQKLEKKKAVGTIGCPPALSAPCSLGSFPTLRPVISRDTGSALSPISPVPEKSFLHLAREASYLCLQFPIPPLGSSLFVPQSRGC